MNNMEEKKNNQVQAMDDDALENISGGWNAVIGSYAQNGQPDDSYGLRTEYLAGIDLSKEEALKLVQAGVNVRKEEGGYYKVGANSAQITGILGTKRDANRYL